MPNWIFLTLLLVATCASVPAADATTEPLQELLALERKAMNGWQTGDPGPQLAITDPQITFIHAEIGKRIEGLPALKELYASYRGAPLFDSFDILSPKLQTAGSVVVLTYQLVQTRGSNTRYWNGTHVYQKTPEGWRVIHSHWSAAKDRQP
ncbi:MAG: DUF4440 domain-containing protein [Acidobacteria bacterium]|nr:DUF4440 domain-containing protein [Acidobacteriota bacterium]